MTDRTITALYDTRAAADAAKARLAAMGLSSGSVDIRDQTSSGAMSAGPGKSEGIIGELKNLFGAHEDTHAYAEGLNRGHFLLTAKVDDKETDQAIAILEQSGAVDFDQKQSEWRGAGWRPPVTSATSAGGDETIKLAEERLVVGKREVERGGVRVRSYVVETPVQEQVTLREEHVDVERRAVDRAVATGDDPFAERTIEMRESAEEAVVGKQAFIKEEVVVGKKVGERTEEIRDTVRHTEVEVDRLEGEANPKPKI